MNWDRIEGNWKQLKGKVKEQWGKLTDDDLDLIEGKRDALAGKIQEAYGVARDEAERQVSDWEKRADERWMTCRARSRTWSSRALSRAPTSGITRVLALIGRTGTLNS